MIAASQQGEPVMPPRKPVPPPRHDAPDERRQRWDASQKALGISRVTIRVHAGDVDRLKVYAARLLKRRGLA